MNFVVVYDACVLYPAPVRDFLLEVAISGLVAAKWTDAIHDEWTRNLIADRPDLKGKLDRTRSLMNLSVPDALVEGYESLIEGLVLPDIHDRHVLAAAIKCNAQAIVTFNVKDFPSENLEPYGMEAIHPDNFIDLQLGLSQAIVIGCAKRIRSRLKNPEFSVEGYLEILASHNLPVTARRLREFAELL